MYAVSSGPRGEVRIGLNFRTGLGAGKSAYPKMIKCLFVDKIDLSAVYSGTLAFGGSALTAFNVNVSESSGRTTIQVDVDGIVGTDLVIRLDGMGLGITASDFVL